MKAQNPWERAPCPRRSIDTIDDDTHGGGGQACPENSAPKPLNPVDLKATYNALVSANFPNARIP